MATLGRTLWKFFSKSSDEMGNSSSKGGEDKGAVVRPFDKDGKGLKLSDRGASQVRRTTSKLHALHQQILDIPYEEYEYPFENMVMEGGGAKGLVYVGALQVLEELGITPKRVAGASAGSIVAALLVAGYTSEEMGKILEMNLEEVLLDHGCGFCSLIPNVVRNFGWNPGNKAENFIGELIAAKLGDPDITFKQLYQMTGKELCITAVNVNMLRVEYFHPETTPDVPVKQAVRVSMSIPGLFAAKRLKNNLGEEDVYVDGGLLCNYPIHAFDGWWLSMKTEDCFLNRIQPLSDWTRLMQKKNRFGTQNTNTLGFLVYSALEQDVMKADLDGRVGVEITEKDRPKESTLYKNREHGIKAAEKAEEEHEIFMRSFERFMKVLKEINSSGETVDDVINKQELKAALNEAVVQGDNASISGTHPQSFTTIDKEILFGVNADLDHIFDDLDADKSGSICFSELFAFIDRAGVNIHKRHQGYNRREVKTLGQFFDGVQDSLLTNIKHIFLNETDIDRTVGINTDYIGTTDFEMEPADRAFCITQGRRATISYLKHYVHKNNLQKKTVKKEPQKTDNGLVVPTIGDVIPPATTSGGSQADTSPQPTETREIQLQEEQTAE